MCVLANNAVIKLNVLAFHKLIFRIDAKDLTDYLNIRTQ